MKKLGCVFFIVINLCSPWGLAGGISGRVVDAQSGEAMSNVTVQVSVTGISIEALTDADGWYNADLGSNNVGLAVLFISATEDRPRVYWPDAYAVNAAGVLAITNAGSCYSGIDFAWPRGAIVRGHILDPEGNPVPSGVGVAVNELGGNGADGVDENGFYEERAVPPGRVRFYGRANNYDTVFWNDGAYETVAAGEVVTRDYVLRPLSATVSIQLFDPDGTVLDRGRIAIYDEHCARLSERRFFSTPIEIPLAPGNYYFSASPNEDLDAVDTWYPQGLRRSPCGFEDGAELQTFAAGENRNLSIRLERAARITGQVVDRGDDPLGGAEVHLLGGPRVLETLTDSNGFFRLPVPESFIGLELVLYIEFRDNIRGYYRNGDTFSMEAFGDERDLGVIRIRQTNNRTGGRVEFPDGSPAPGTAISLRMGGVEEQLVYADAEGCFDFDDNLSIGRHQIVALGRGRYTDVYFWDSTLDVPEIFIGSTTVLTNILLRFSEELLMVTGTVINAEGDPLSRVVVHLQDRSRSALLPTATTDVQGRYRLLVPMELLEFRMYTESPPWLEDVWSDGRLLSHPGLGPLLSFATGETLKKMDFILPAVFEIDEVGSVGPASIRWQAAPDVDYLIEETTDLSADEWTLAPEGSGALQKPVRRLKAGAFLTYQRPEAAEGHHFRIKRLTALPEAE